MPTGKREAVDERVGEEAVSISMASPHLGIAKSLYYEYPASRSKPMNLSLGRLIKWLPPTIEGS